MDNYSRLYKLLNSRIFRCAAVQWIVNRIIDNVNILKSLFGGNPSFVGQTRLVNRVAYYFNNGVRKVRITPSGIFCDGILQERFKYHIGLFIRQAGIEIDSGKVEDINNAITTEVLHTDKNTAKKLYRLRGLFKIVSIGSVFSIGFILFKMFSQDSSLSASGRILEGLWIIPNLYFISQTFLFYLSWIKYYSMKTGFSEAGEEEERSLKLSEKQPYVLSVVPAHKEEPELLERVLYSLCLQNYGNMKVVLLLGNDVYTDDNETLQNTREVKKAVVKIKKELRKQNWIITKKYKEFMQHDTVDSKELSKVFKTLQLLYKDTAEWFINKANELLIDNHEYPTDGFLIENTFLKQYEFYKNRSISCEKLSQAVLKGSGDTRKAFSDGLRSANEFFIELSRVFNTSLSVFMRYKYSNTEHEKTKAGNLSAYTALIGGRWKTAKNEEGKPVLLASETGKYIQEPEYFASFDSDTIPKPNYILRKVAFMQREENSKVGLIQSPYIVPSPEKENVASATGIQSYWFLPISVGLSAFKSSFWLGYNGVLRFDAVKKIKSFITDTIIEDTQNSLKLKSAGYEIITSPEEQCVTFSPYDLKALKVQRIRWASGGFKIARDLIRSMRNGTSGLKNIKEKVLALNYVIGLNILPIVITALYFLESPFHYQYYLVESIPFFLYVLSYVSLLKAVSHYKFRHMLDGLALSPFLNLYHIMGTLKSIRQLFVSEKSRVFKSTPRIGKVNIGALGNLEFYGITLIIFWLGFRLINQISLGIFYDIFPVYQLLLTLYGVRRFKGSKEKKKTEQNLSKLEKSGSETVSNEKSVKGGLAGIKLMRFTRTAFLSLVILSLFTLSVFRLYEKNLMMDYDKKVILTNVNYLKYKEKSGEMLSALRMEGERTELNAFKQRDRLGKGINFGSALEAPIEGKWGVYLEEEYFSTIKKAGFDTVRIPINWSAYTSADKPYLIDETFFSRIDWVLVNAKKNKLNAVLEMHSYDEINVNINQNAERFISMWEQIAERYKDCDSSLYFELLNEPHAKLTTQNWNKLLGDTVKAIRDVDSYHTLIVSGAQWGNAYGLKGLKIPEEEKNTICTFHTYTPMAFTHQGVNYVEKEYSLLKDKIVWPGPPRVKYTLSDELKKYGWLDQWINNYNTLPYNENPAGPKPIIEELDLANSWEKQSNIPLWLGEFGVTKNADMTSRINYTRYIVQEAKKRGITWAYWDFAANCGVYNIDKKAWEQELLKALVN